jgi:hypothetical protein
MNTKKVTITILQILRNFIFTIIVLSRGKYIASVTFCVVLGLTVAPWL